jgi:hypothetical protein
VKGDNKEEIIIWRSQQAARPTLEVKVVGREYVYKGFLERIYYGDIELDLIWNSILST